MSKLDKINQDFDCLRRGCRTVSKSEEHNGHISAWYEKVHVKDCPTAGIVEDYPEFDCTDFAHRAWWRGCDYGCIQTCEAITRVLDGEIDKPSFGGKELNVLAERILKLMNK